MLPEPPSTPAALPAALQTGVHEASLNGVRHWYKVAGQSAALARSLPKGRIHEYEEERAPVMSTAASSTKRSLAHGPARH
ncbi:MAG: hypothetical protein ACXW27_13540 [Allosphingosinicella sp.]